MKRPMFRPARVGAMVVLVATAAGVSWAAAALQETGFPHERHQGLFPVCTGCHEGVPENDRSRFFPPVAQCNVCHVGDQEREDTWSERGPRAGNLRFQHGFHEMFGAAAPTCEQCHVPAESPRMSVSDDIQLEVCWTCHGGPGTDHVVDGPCATCHVPLAETRLPVDRIQRFPFPADHGAPTWLAEQHGVLAAEQTARCATCHARDRCIACHVDTDREAISAIPQAPPDLELPPTYARYVAPGSHAADDWLFTHRNQASRQECGTCHTSDDCRACHVAPPPDAVSSLLDHAETVAPGVGLERRAPPTHERAFFMEAHPSLASSEGGACAQCHQDDFCVQCHEGPSDGGYHPSNFVARHPAEAFGRDAECSTCHNSQLFCRACHLEAGLGSAGRLGPGYHDAQSLWLLRHGQAARQNLESCVTCHSQRDCTQCHGVLGAFKVSPHGRDFDAQAAWERSPRTCLACHVRIPVGGGGT